MKAPKFPIYWVVLFFVSGMILSHWMDLPEVELLYLLIAAIIGIGLLKKEFRGLVFLLFLPLGFLQHQQFYTQSENHYSHFLTEGKKSALKIKLTQKLKPNDFQYRFYGKVIQVEDNRTGGKILIAINRDSLMPSPKSGKIILTVKQPQQLRQRINPGGFDYKAYLEKIKIYDQLNLSKEDYKSLKAPAKRPVDRFRKFNDQVEKKLDQSPLNIASKNTIKALLLGKRDTLDQSLVQAYADAGVIHILAISGLHVGIIMLFLGFLLKPIQRLPKGQLIYISLIILLLWAFAFFTGASASVVRAVTMFTGFAIAKYSRRIHNSFHLLVVSFFILLLCYPPYLYQVGFQMSYLAVLGIIKIHPLLQSIWKPKMLIMRRFWELTTVCLAAQIAVAPLSIYYFHQFPGLFMLTNWLILPFFSLFLIGSVGMLIIILLGLSFDPIINLYDLIVVWMNKIIFWIAAQEGFLFKNISLSIFVLVMLYFFIACLYGALKTKKIHYIFASIISIIFLQIFYFLKQAETSKTDNLWIFYQYNNTVIAHHSQKTFSIYSPTQLGENERLISDFKNEYPIENINFKAFRNTYISKNERLLVVDENAIYQLPDFYPTQLLLINDPKVNLDRVLSGLKPKTVIADGSNKPWNIARWEKSCKRMKISFVNLRLKGAYQISF